MLALLIHGDAAFAGQGVVAESLAMSELDAYGVGGTLHVVVNNQVGFTTSPRDARSTTYATGLATMLDVPIFHVNGEDLEAVAQAVLLAVDFRQRFRRDAVIDLWCYRKHGHNEGDEPAFTQPVMVRAIAAKESARTLAGRELALRLGANEFLTSSRRRPDDLRRETERRASLSGEQQLLEVPGVNEEVVQILATAQIHSPEQLVKMPLEELASITNIDMSYLAKLRQRVISYLSAVE